MLSLIEGVITTLKAEGGVISKKHDFLKSDALSDWKKLKVGSKVCFLMYQNAAKSIELAEQDWLEGEEEEEENKTLDATRDNTVECNVDKRTIVGTIENIVEGVMIINVGGPKPIDVAPENFTDLKWDFAERDTVSSRD